jgi:hypothetical protein
MACKNIIPTDIGIRDRIIVIGDLHGDVDALKKCLEMSKLIDSNGNWIGGNTVLIQIGDIIDSMRGEILSNDKSRFSFFAIEKILSKLGKQAEKIGFKNKNGKKMCGKVISLLGNHEIMNLKGDFRYVGSKQYEESSDYLDSNNENHVQNRNTLFKEDKKFRKLIACNKTLVLKSGKWIFVHGGLVFKLVKKYSLERINEIARQWILGIDIDEIELNEVLFEKYSPTWYRGYGKQKADCKELNKVLNILKSSNMVIGHTVQENNINSKCNGKVWRIDTGLSLRTNVDTIDSIQVLEILNNKEINIFKYSDYLFSLNIISFLKKFHSVKINNLQIIPNNKNPDFIFVNNKIKILNNKYDYLKKYLK